VSDATYRYAEAEPHPSLAPWILNYWQFEVDAIPTDAPPFTVWPDGCVSIAIIPSPIPGPRVMLTGPRVTAMRPPLRPHSRLLGLRLWPDVAQQVLGMSARELRDATGPARTEIATRCAPLVDALGRAATLDAARLAFDAWLSPLCNTLEAPDAQVRRAVQFIVAERGEVDMPAVALEATLGLRQLQRRFLQTTGLTLREWARVRRLRESLALHMTGESSGWSEVAATVGFADHPHLSREFVTLTGLVPTAAARQLGATQHRDVRP
jgi:AraC-like DNA-binding protein